MQRASEQQQQEPASVSEEVALGPWPFHTVNASHVGLVSSPSLYRKGFFFFLT